MHGLFLVYIEEFVKQRLLDDECQSMLFRRAGVEYTVFLPQGVYDREIANRIFSSAAELRGESLPDFLREYGKFMFGHLFRVYEPRVPGECRDLFSLVRLVEGLVPARVSFEEVSPRRGLLQYRPSETDDPTWCHLVEGLLEGSVRRFNQKVAIRSASCVRQGASHCTFELRPHVRASSATLRVVNILNGEGDPEDEG